MELLNSTLFLLSTLLPLVQAFPAADAVLQSLNKRAHGKPFCSPTGPGVCNFAFQEWHVAEGDHLHEERWIYVYNNYCDEIGSAGGWLTDFALTSQLPYVIVGNYDKFQFCYAGKCSGWHLTDCFWYSAYDKGYNMVYQCAFDC